MNARKDPKNWDVTADGDTINALNNVTGEVFSGTMAAFNAIFKSDVNTLAVDEMIPVLLPSNGVVDSDGLLTLDVAVNGLSGKTWVYLPANAFATADPEADPPIPDNPDGYYLVDFSSTSEGTVYDNYIAHGVTFIPYDTPFGSVIVGGDGDPYTQDVTSINLLKSVIGQSLYSLDLVAELQNENSANDKTINCSIDTISKQIVSTTETVSMFAANMSTVGAYKCCAISSRNGNAATAMTTESAVVSTTQDSYEVLVEATLEDPTTSYVLLKKFGLNAS